MLDSTGLCLFARPPVIADPQLMVDMLNGIYGWNWTKEDLDQYNRDVLGMNLNSTVGQGSPKMITVSQNTCVKNPLLLTTLFLMYLTRTWILVFEKL